MIKPLVAIVGRPNVGKSTLFNRIIGQRLAVVSDIAGTTRDRLYAEAEWADRSFKLVDTGGIELVEGWNSDPLSEDSEQFMPMIRAQAAMAIDQADVIILVVDGQAGITAADREVAEILRRTRKPIFVAANKLESLNQHHDSADFYALGLGEVFAITALHGRGVADLLDRLIDDLPASPIDDEAEDETIKIAILGRPNVGKSTLVNKLLGEERVIVSPIAGTTRDAIDTRFVWHGQEFTLIDTAGIRRRGKIDPGIEKYSVLRALRSVERADVALLVIDATDGVTAQDAHIAGMIRDESKAGVIVVVNKWDEVEKDSFTIYDFTDKARADLSFLPYVPFIFISALTGQRVGRIMPLVTEVNESRYFRIRTGELNRIVREALAKHSPSGKHSRLKILYATQASVAPPTFVFFVNDPTLVHFTYERFLENQLRDYHPFEGTPIRLFFRSREEERYGR